MEKVLIVENLCKRYGIIEAATDVSFDVNRGEIFALIGPNGAGKSTTLRMISTLLTPTSGTAIVNNYDIVTQSDCVRQSISYLPEEAGAYKNLTGKNYLDFMASLYTNNKQKHAEYIEFAYKISGLGDRLKDKVSTYSKGMTRKLLLARTVMSRPCLAILDEPTSGLDVINALEIRKIIKDLTTDGMSVLLSSHNMLEIEFLSDRVGIISAGIIHEIGTPKELKKKYDADNLEEVFVKLVKK